jgi:signal transduction histidine kinase
MVQLIANVVDRFQDHAASREITIQSDLPLRCPLVEADPQRIEQVLVNLLDNALRHSPKSGVIFLAVSCDLRFLTITIRDTGPGIPESALPHIFERFYRVDRARSRDQGGTGLGLAIARNLVENHHGKLSAGNHTDGGAIFTVQIPILQSTA